jgi:hypothetical protein
MIVEACYINWIFHLSCDMLTQKNVTIAIVRVMRLAYKLSAWTDSFCNAHKSIMEAFLMVHEKMGILDATPVPVETIALPHKG